MSSSENQYPHFARPGWRHSRAMRVVLAVLYVIFATLLLTLTSWSPGGFLLKPHSGLSVRVQQLGRGTALIAVAILALQVVLAARLKMLDRPFGLDRVMRFHKSMAVVALSLLAAHPVLMAWSFGDASIFSLNAGMEVNLGKAALVLLLLTILFALLFRRLGVNYQVWRFLHKGTILVVILGFTHGFLMADDLAVSAAKTGAWGLLVLAAGFYIYRNVFVPLWGRQRFSVVSVEPQTHNTWTLTFQPEGGGRIVPYRPGQFMFLKLRRKGFRAEQHPFTISSSPTLDGAITATIKESGDFTRTIGRTQPQDVALIEAPFGRFSFVHHKAKRLLFIAGGVGITPIMSMLRFLHDTRDQRPVTLIYANRAERDIVFRDELQAMPPNVKVAHILSEPDENWAGPRGYVTAEAIRQYGGEGLGDSHVYLCGPWPMMKAVRKTLRSLGVSSRRVHYEKFSI